MQLSLLEITNLLIRLCIILPSVKDAQAQMIYFNYDMENLKKNKTNKHIINVTQGKFSKLISSGKNIVFDSGKCIYSDNLFVS